MVLAAAAAPMVCRSPPAQKARPSPSITSTRISSLASTSAPSCSSFLAIERSIELNAAGRLSWMVAIGPSILSSAGSLEGVAVAGLGVGIGGPRGLIGRGAHLNRRRQEVTIPAKSAKCAPTFLLGRDALAPPRTMRPNREPAIVRDADTSAAPQTTSRASQNRQREGTTWVIPVCLQLGLPDDGGTGSHHRRRPRRLSARGIAATEWFWRARMPDQPRSA